MLIQLFYFWLLLIPFSWILTFYSGFIALDKLIAPALLLLAIFFNRRSPPERVTKIIIYAFLVSAIALLKNISFIGDPEIFYTILWEDLVRAGYFIIPVLFIRDMKTFHRCGWIVSAIAIIGLLSAFFVAMDLLTLPMARFEISRIGVESIQKSIGIFPSYGDLAQFVSFAIAWLILLPGVTKTKSRKWTLLRLSLFLSFVLGIAGAQSRNVLLSGILSIGLYWLFNQLQGKRGDTKVIMTTLISIGGGITAILAITFYTYVVENLSGIGGGLARQTASIRLEQYSFGWQMIKEYPLLGIDLEGYRQHSGAVASIHNMWIQLAATGGMITVLFLIALLIKIFSSTRKTAGLKSKWREATVISIYLCILLFSTMFYPAMGELFWALLGIGASLSCFRLHPTTRTPPRKTMRVLP